MIHEHALLRIHPGQEADFEAAFARARPIIEGSPGAGRATLARCVEEPGSYLLLVEWVTVAAHTEGFRGSPAFGQWRELVGPFFAGVPDVAHFAPVAP